MAVVLIVKVLLYNHLIFGWLINYQLVRFVA